jgi:hypothetical protein
MRIGIDAHILLRQHKRYSRSIAEYAEKMITALLKADKEQKHTWVLFFDGKLADRHRLNLFLQALDRPNVEVRTFPFMQYRRYLPVMYSHLLMAAFLRSAKLDVFHSPEGLIPMAYPGKMITTFHYVPRGKLESNLFVRTFMLGARVAFTQMCRAADRIVVTHESDKKLLEELWHYPSKQIMLLPLRKAWKAQAEELLGLYERVAKPRKAKGKTREQKKRKAKGKK